MRAVKQPVAVNVAFESEEGVLIHGFARMNESPEVLRRFPTHLASLSLSDDQPKPGFSGAGVVRLTDAESDYALRMWPGNRPPTARILGLHKLLSEVYAAGVTQVAVPIPNSAGSTLSEHSGKLWQLEPWMPGVADWVTRPSADRLRNAMDCLAEFHLAARNFKCPANAKQWFFRADHQISPAIQERHRLLNDWLADGLNQISLRLSNNPDLEFRQVATQIVALAKETGPAVLEQLRQTQDRRFSLQPCLRDVWHDHVLFSADQVTGLIDANACRTENVATDLARLLGSCVGDDQQQFALAVDHYSQRRQLSSDERTLIGILDRSSVVLSGLTWLRRRYHDVQANTEVQWGRVFERLVGFRDRLVHLADSPHCQ